MPDEEDFDTRRGELMAVASMLEEAHPLFCPSLPGIAGKLSDARAALLESAVVLCLIGAEGAGKSSFLNSILGIEAVPTESGRAGTVAPTLVHWHNSETPDYRIVLAGSDEPIPCQDREQFRRFMLQRKGYNPENEKGVAGGIVGLQHNLLADGLRLVDMPGVGGLSSTVHKETLEALREAHSVLVVVRDRDGYADSLPLLAHLVAQGVKIQALVNNITTKAWLGGDGLRIIEESRQSVRMNLADWGVQLDESMIFVLHLPSIQGLRLGPKPWVLDPAHKAEVDRFRLWLSRYIDSARSGRFICEAANALLGVADEIEERNRAYRKQLKAIARRPTSADARAAGERLDSCQAAFATRWKMVLAEPLVAEVISRQRETLASLLRLHGEQAREAIGLVPRSAAALSLLPSSEIVAKLKPVFEAAHTAIEAAHDEGIYIIVERLRQIADEAALALFEAVPSFQGKLGSVHVTGEFVVHIDHPRADPEGLLEMFSTARINNRILITYQAATARMAPGSDGPAIQTFESNVRNSRDAFARAFADRIATLRQFLQQRPCDH